MAWLLYGAGFRLLEALRLRVKDLEFGGNQLTVRSGKGRKDRVTVLPMRLRDPLRLHLRSVKVLHASDVRDGFGSVYLPNALHLKYPNAPRA